MTVAFSSGTGRRTGVALGAVSAGLLVLSACDKPTPLATVTVGDTSVHTEAACYNDGEPLEESEIERCLNEKADKTIEFAMDDTVHIGVDPEIADNGWTIFVNGEQAEQEPFKKTYRSIPGNAFFAGQPGETSTNRTQISVVEAKGEKLTGVWHFVFEKTS